MGLTQFSGIKTWYFCVLLQYSGSWWWTGRPGVLWFMGSQRFGQDWATELNWTGQYLKKKIKWICLGRFIYFKTKGSFMFFLSSFRRKSDMEKKKEKFLRLRDYYCSTVTRNHCWSPVALIIILFTELRKILHAFGIINTTSLCYLLFFWVEGTNCIHFNSRHLKIHSFFF